MEGKEGGRVHSALTTMSIPEICECGGEGGREGEGREEGGKRRGRCMLFEYQPCQQQVSEEGSWDECVCIVYRQRMMMLQTKWRLV